MKRSKAASIVDAVIVGGGYLGLLSGIALAKLGLKTAVLEKGSFNAMAGSHSPCRLFAISQGSCQIIKRHLELDLLSFGQKINHIRVMEFNVDAYLDFDPKNLGLPNFGIMIEESKLHSMLLSEARKQKGLVLVDGCRIHDVVNNEDFAEIITEKGVYKAGLALICDGKNSLVRSLLGIETHTKSYDQMGVVCDVGHKLSHHGIAVEKFIPQGPFAILPKEGGHESSIVWTLETKLAHTLLNLDKDSQFALLKERFGDYLGEIKIKSKLKGYPLELKYTTQYSSGRFYLLGDALHAIHPIAGQGLNLSVRDFNVLMTAVSDSIGQGLNIGANYNILKYFKSRHFDNQVMIESTSILNALFSNNVYAVKCARSIGLDLVNNMPAAKKFFMSYASGQ
ncbi:MAG: Ubiquinone biosynthesis hydroxylase, UbiH/UbiF/VisC/COQ6 [Candidatus Midichloriaceae bacterium]|jgi:2-octaprenyl-6-methoxyphenol hydroxylase|nr:Ubiquinone biosynthesis hydroxylase, UbiH/UbiF/VisC/COQ6 [Candidatus Midichloriaceae bacterium]